MFATPMVLGGESVIGRVLVTPAVCGSKQFHSFELGVTLFHCLHTSLVRTDTYVVYNECAYLIVVVVFLLLIEVSVY